MNKKRTFILLSAIVIVSILGIIVGTYLFYNKEKPKEDVKPGEKTEEKKPVNTVDESISEELRNFMSFYITEETASSEVFTLGLFSKERDAKTLDDKQKFALAFYYLDQNDFVRMDSSEDEYTLEVAKIDAAMKKALGPDVTYEIGRGVDYYGRLGHFTDDKFSFVSVRYLPDLSKFHFKPAGIGFFWCGPSSLYSYFDRAAKDGSDILLTYKVLYTDNKAAECSDKVTFKMYSDAARTKEITEFTFDFDFVETSNADIEKIIKENANKAGEIQFRFKSDGTGGYYFSDSSFVK